MIKDMMMEIIMQLRMQITGTYGLTGVLKQNSIKYVEILLADMCKEHEK